MTYIVLATMPPYTVKAQVAIDADSWDGVLAEYPDAKLIKTI